MQDAYEEETVYLAHKDGERIQTIREHAEGTALLAKKFADAFGKGDWGYCCGMLHDIGKYSAEFQRKIKENLNTRVDHSTAGMQVCIEKGGPYQWMSYCIAGHHAGLPDYGNKYDDGTAPSLTGRREKKICDYRAYQNEITVPEIYTRPLGDPKEERALFSRSVFIRMLYSCLVDADFLDTEAFMKNGETGRGSGERMEILLQKLEQYVANWLENTETETVNGRRTEILRYCLEEGKNPRGLYRLTVPTGGGKTVASLAFALRHAVQKQMDRVIYVIPYTSIIEQNAGVFRAILGSGNVLENHCNVDYKSSEELDPMQLAAENWDMPVVVTTNVQFFESLFANKPSKCRKLHNIANSVVVFDEAQMLPNDYLIPCTAIMEEMMDHYRASIVLCTATQPSLDKFFSAERKITELCPRMEEQFRFFKRNSFCPLGRISEDALAERLEKENQALCIVNTRKRAQLLFGKLKGEGVYHLSTVMYPKHRKRVLAEVRERLKKKQKCILISTSLVEAGVDLDFHTVYRQLAGVDSMNQAAGRCNRNGKFSAEECRVFLFQLDGREYNPGQAQKIDVAKALYAEGWELSAQETVAQYFERLYHLQGENLDKKNIMGELKTQRFPFAKIGELFKLIEKESKIIFIAKEDEAKELLKKMRYQGGTKETLRLAQQYCVSIYEEEFEKMRAAGILGDPIADGISDFYELLKPEMYTAENGLRLDVELGIAEFM